jgi:Ca2+/Na+ antiporter
MGKIIENKTGIVNEYLKLNNIHKYETKDFINSNDIKNKLLESEKEEKERKEKNIEVIRTWIGPPLIIVLTLIFICIIMLRVNKIKWTGVDSVGLTLVVTAYVTEIVIFFGIIKRYEFLGDQPLYYFIYNLIKKEIQKTKENKENEENEENEEKQINLANKLDNTLNNVLDNTKLNKILDNTKNNKLNNLLNNTLNKLNNTINNTSNYKELGVLDLDFVFRKHEY